MKHNKVEIKYKKTRRNKGLPISEQLTPKIRSTSKAERNTKDGISLATGMSLLGMGRGGIPR